MIEMYNKVMDVDRHEKFLDEVNLKPADESVRRISEADYTNCWEKRQFSRGGINLSRKYSFDVPPPELQYLVDTGKATIYEGKDSSGKAVPGLKLVEYAIIPEELGIPHFFPISEFQNVDFLLTYSHLYKELNIDPKLQRHVQRELLEPAAGKLIKFISELRTQKVITDSEFFITEDRRMELFEPWVDDHDFRYQIAELRERCPNIVDEDDASFIKKAAQSLENICEERIGDPQRKYDLLDDLQGDVGNFSLEQLTPHAALIYDSWVDSRFKNGVISAGIAMGTIRTVQGGADKDVPALIELYRKAKSQFVDDGKPFQRHKKLYVPPNMTNAYIVKIPAITPEIVKIEEVLKPEMQYGGVKNSVTLVFCDRIDAINPTLIPERMDEIFGSGNYAVVSNGDSDLVQYVPKKQEDQRAKPRKYGTDQNGDSRPNIPFPTEPHLNEP